jgi:alkaline phosphatase D
MPNSSRRSFLKHSVYGAASLTISSALTSCASSTLEQPLSQVTFEHGVASGDPLASALIIWTRAEPINSEQQVTLAWEVATTADFNQIIRQGITTTTHNRDFTVKIDVQDLIPNTEYFYRFKGDTNTSPIGRGKTLPISDVSQVKMVVVSCSNYPAGYFNAYDDAAKQADVDVVLHLGDYIYEYGMGDWATDKSVEIGRQLAADNATEILRLEDYRKRYALYRTDKGLQALHAAAPFIVVWDDHEISNDTWKNGAENHSPDEGDFTLRRANAIQAYYEWLPIRPPMGDSHPQIYRSFDFANLLSLHMLDTRVIARDQQLEYKSYQDPNTKQIDMARFQRDLTSPTRALLGKDQFTWLSQSMQASSAKWQMLGQQVLMTKMYFPAEVFNQQKPEQIEPVVRELVAIKRAINSGNSVSKEQMARLNTVMPYNLDAWDGYPQERENLYRLVKQMNKQILVVAGDTHNAWQGRLTDNSGEKIGMEFATPGVSSPGMESYLNLSPKSAQDMAKAITMLVKDLEYCDLHQRGYMMLTIEPQQVTTSWRFVDNIQSPEYRIIDQHQTVYTV